MFVLFLSVVTTVRAEDGSRLWLRYEPAGKAFVSGAVQTLAAEELRQYYQGDRVHLLLDASVEDDEAYRISGDTLAARSERGLLYGAYALLRGDRRSSAPRLRLRLLNHWDNLDGSIERGYAGKSFFWSREDTLNVPLIKAYARANASIGINGTVLNNVNASPRVLSATGIARAGQIADILRPYGIRVYLSVNFASPMALGGLGTADPLDEGVRGWWQQTVREIYQTIPDFGGFLVKANSEGQPGPGDYQRSHAEGANMLADALAPYGGIVMWRSFVYGANHKGEDRVKQAVSEFKPLDGQFRDNVILQSKNGPLDFQPREPYAPIFDQMTATPLMAELQITQEYLGQSTHLVYLAPMWREFFSFVDPGCLQGIAGVANTGLDTNWCGHDFAQANWYAFGRLAWDPSLTSEEIAAEWVAATFGPDALSAGDAAIVGMMMRSREACVDYMMPLGLHHIFKFDHHYGPEPDGFRPRYPLEWCPVYYHQADSAGVGFDRSHSGSDAVSQYRQPFKDIYDNPATCPEEYLLWFHHVPWTYRMQSGRSLWQEMQYRYRRGVTQVEDFVTVWQEVRPCIDDERWTAVDVRLHRQLDNAREWRDVCLRYFGSFAEPTHRNASPPGSDSPRTR